MEPSAFGRVVFFFGMMNRRAVLCHLFCVGSTLSALMAPAHAIDMVPYTAHIFHAEQAAGEPVRLHFHANR